MSPRYHCSPTGPPCIVQLLKKKLTCSALLVNQHNQRRTIYLPVSNGKETNLYILKKSLLCLLREGRKGLNCMSLLLWKKCKPFVWYATCVNTVAPQVLPSKIELIVPALLLYLQSQIKFFL